MVEEGKAVDVVYLYFSKAFDMVSHSILLGKLAACILDMYNLLWVRNWIEGHAQRVVNCVNPAGDQSLVTFPTGQYWGQFHLISLKIIWLREWSSPSVSVQKTPG